MLGLYQRRFEGRRLRPDEYVISANEKSQLQALGRRHPSAPPEPPPTSFGRVEERTGIEPFGRLVEQVMSAEPYASARRVFCPA